MTQTQTVETARANAVSLAEAVVLVVAGEVAGVKVEVEVDIETVAGLEVEADTYTEVTELSYCDIKEGGIATRVSTLSTVVDTEALDEQAIDESLALEIPKVEETQSE